MTEPDYKALCKRLSDALLKIRPLGGSEIFIKVGEDYFADPNYCGALIEYTLGRNHELMKELTRARKA